MRDDELPGNMERLGSIDPRRLSLAVLILLVLASWLGPVVRDIRMERRAQWLLLDELKQAREEGHSISSFELHSGVPIAHYSE